MRLPYHGSLLKFTPTRAAFARLGLGASPFPSVSALMQPSDSLPPSTTAPVPLAMIYPDAGACSVPHGPTTPAPANAPCVGDHSPALRKAGVLSRKGEGLPGSWAVLFVRALVEHPAGYDPLLAP